MLQSARGWSVAKHELLALSLAYGEHIHDVVSNRANPGQLSKKKNEKMNGLLTFTLVSYLKNVTNELIET